jgi:hypothetical protein
LVAASTVIPQPPNFRCEGTRIGKRSEAAHCEPFYHMFG